MAKFLEFLKSGKSAKEFIDASILPQHVLPVEQTQFSPVPYENEELESGENTDDAIDSALDQLPESDSPKEDDAGEDKEILENVESGDETDSRFLAALDAAENEGMS